LLTLRQQRTRAGRLGTHLNSLFFRVRAPLFYTVSSKITHFWEKLAFF
jgi:hypothetical protein